MSYDMIDRFLRNNLGDDDYAEYSAALDAICAQPVASEPSSGERADIAKDLRELVDLHPWARDVCEQAAALLSSDAKKLDR